MKIKTARYVKSCGSLKDCGTSSLPEFAFIGRSNVGKSSLINMITNNSKLAHTSTNPGKTQCINMFLVNESWHLVDLPGYGYARVSKEKRVGFSEMIQNYLIKRDNLSCVFVLIDARIPPQQIDLNFINWLGEKELPFIIVFTKADKVGKQKIERNMHDFFTKLTETWSELPGSIVSSAVDALGKDEIISFIANTIQTISPSENLSVHTDM